jgi:hypothetical protein
MNWSASYIFTGFIYYGFLAIGSEGLDLTPVCEIALHQGNVWNIHSVVDRNISILNLAMPEYSAEYWVSCFDLENERDVVVAGTFPDWADFASVSTYDMAGEPIAGCGVSTYDGAGSDLNISACRATVPIVAVVSRTYSRMDSAGQYRRVSTGVDDRNDDRNDDRPIITIDGLIAPSCSAEVSDTVSRNIESLIEGILVDILVQPPDSEMALPFHSVPTNSFSGLFPNENSMYLMKFVRSNETAVVRGRAPCPSDPGTSLSYYGLIVADTATSRTDDALSWQEIYADTPCVPGAMVEYSVVVAGEGARGGTTGTTGTTFSLTWSSATTQPVLVVRFLTDPSTNRFVWTILQYADYFPPSFLYWIGVPVVMTMATTI